MNMGKQGEQEKYESGKGSEKKRNRDRKSG